jgi:release factor glutamine methyltransferase
VAAETPIALARKAAEVLAARGIENARLDAELLLAAVLGVRRLDLYLQHERPVTGDELEAYRAAIRRRMRREPVQYIIGRAAFRDLDLVVDARVLIPRPETELLVGEALRWATRRQGAESGARSALDIGTGSGAIAICLAREGGFQRVVATDVSVDALEVARTNAERYGVEDRIELRYGDGYEVVAPEERFSAIISNPPYIAEAERAALQPEVAEHEPAQALFAADGGLAVLRVVVAGATDHLEAGGLLALEMGITQPPAIVEAIERSGAFETPCVINDLTGRPRIVTAVRTA